MITRLIGDTHGKIEQYLALIQGVNSSVQLGDMGIGFGIELPNLAPDYMFIRGNHDDPALCKQHPNYIPDGTIKDNVMYVGGAWSIDWEYRQNYEWQTGRKIWWKDEEISMQEGLIILGRYEFHKPQVMLTHDCPTIAANALDSHHAWDESKTRTLFDPMLMTHSPDVWVFAHHHINKTMDIMGTRFIVLDELAFIDLDI